MSYLTPIRDSDILDGLSVRYLKVFGLWSAINDYRITGKMNAMLKFGMMIAIICAMPYICCHFLSYFVIEIDIQKVTFLNLYFLPALQVSSKILVFLFRMDSQCKLYDLMRKDFLKIPENKRGEVREIYLKITRRCNSLCLAAFLVNTSVVALSILDPGISVDYIAHHTGSMATVAGGRKKVLSAWYPLPMAESPYYEAIFAYETAAVIWGGILLAVYDCLFYQILMCLYAQFSVFGYHVSTLRMAKQKELMSDNKSDSSVYIELYEILQDHQKLLSYADELKSVYNPLVTIILGMAMALLIATVFQFMFAKTGNSMFIYKFLQFLIYQVIEVSMFCFGSSSVEKASSDLQFAIYSSDWYKSDTKFRKAAQMMMLRARKGVTLTAIKMYPVNVETIMAILQFTYSVAALMSRMTD